MVKILVGFLVLAIFLEGIVTSLPLVLLCLILLTIKLRSTEVFLLAFFSGMMLDVLHVRSVGLSSMFFLTILLLIFLYERKYEVSSFLFVVIITGIASFVYFLVFPVPQSFIQIIFSVVLAGFAFSLSQMAMTRSRKGELKL